MRIATTTERQNKPERAANAYQQVADIWEKACKDETNTELKAFYQQKYLYFQQKALELRNTHSIEDSGLVETDVQSGLGIHQRAIHQNSTAQLLNESDTASSTRKPPYRMAKK